MAAFDPNNVDAFLAERQLPSAKQNADAVGLPTVFDPNNPDQFMKDRGIQAAPPPPVSNTAAQAYANAAPIAGQGFAGGFGKQLNAGMQAGMGAVDQIVNGQNNFGDVSKDADNLYTRTVDAISNVPKNYSSAKAGVQAQINKVRAEHPVASALLEITSSLPSAYLGAGLLRGVGIANTLAQAGTLGATYGYGSSQNEGLSRIKDAAVAGGISLGAAGAMQGAAMGLKALGDVPYESLVADEYANYAKPIKDIANAKVTETPYGLNFKPKMADAFSIGQDLKSMLINPNTQALVTKEFNAQPQIAQDLIDKTNERLGNLRTPLLEQHGHVTTDSDSILNKAYNTANDIAVERDPRASELQKGLFERIRTMVNGFTKEADPFTGASGEMSLKQLSDAQASLGQAIWRDKAYSGSPSVEGAAKRIWGQFADAASKLDETQGSGGQLAQINKVFKAMYGMEDNMIKGQTIRAMVDPQGANAANSFQKFVQPFEQLDPSLRQTLAPEMHDYLANQFPKVFAKAKTMLVATERGGPSAGPTKQILTLAGLRGLRDATLMNGANLAGVASTMNPPSLSPAVSTMAGQALNIAAPSIGGQQVNGR